MVNTNIKIVITTDGSKTFAKMYNGKTLIDKAEVRYNQNDYETFPFDFVEGAGWAFEKLTGLSVQHKNVSVSKPKTTKPKFKIGDHVYIKESLIEGKKYGGMMFYSPMTIYQGWIGSITEISDEGNYIINGLEGLYWSDDMLELVKQEPKKVCCYKSCGNLSTKGKVYVISNNGEICFDNGVVSAFNWHKGIPRVWQGYFAPLVNRSAKVGDWIYVTKAPHHVGYYEGDIFEVKVIDKMKDGFVLKPFVMYYDEYLVIDDYQPNKMYYE